MVEEHIEAIFKSAPLGVGLIDSLTGKILWTNKRYSEIVGRSKSELTSIDWMKITHPDDIQKDLDKMILLNSGKEAGFNMVKRLIKKDGSIIWVNLIVTSIASDINNGPRHLAMIEEITNQKIIENRLDEERKLNSLILSSAGEGIYGLDKNGITTFVSLSVEKMLGYSKEELIGQPQHSLIHHTYADGTPYPKQKCHIYEAIKDGKIHQESNEVFWRKDGTSFPVEYISRPIIEGDEIKGAVVTFRNISERKNIESQLIEAKEIAQKASKAKSEFLASMSHELRTPMNAILGFTQLLGMSAKDKLDQTEKRNLERICSAGSHLLELIIKVLDLSAIESGKLELSIRAIDMVAIVDDVLAVSMPMAEERGVSLEHLNNSLGNCLVNADSLRLRQVVLNLVSNAIKYNIPDGLVTVSYEKRENGKIRLAVKDTGLGIPENKRDKLFKPFERFNLDAEHIEGAGIGLNISKKFMEMMGGEIGYDNREGEGSIFYIDVPTSEKTA